MPRTLPRLTLAFLVSLATVILVFPANARPAKSPDKTPTASNAVEAAEQLQQTPDGALRVFLAAMIGSDTAILHQVILPVSAADFQVLAGAKSPSDKDRATGVVGIASMQFRVLQPGDLIALPGGHSLRITRNDVDADHVLLQMPGGPVPVLVRRIKNLWYVDATSIIAARKTAAELSRTLPTPHTHASGRHK